MLKRARDVWSSNRAIESSSFHSARVGEGYVRWSLNPYPLILVDRNQNTLNRHRYLDSKLDPMFENSIFFEDVLLAIERDPSLDAIARKELRDRANWIMCSPQNAFELNERAWAIVDPDNRHNGNVALGLKMARLSVEDSPEDASYRDTLAWALFANGEYENAVAESRHALGFADKEDKKAYLEYLNRMLNLVEERESRDKAGLDE